MIDALSTNTLFIPAKLSRNSLSHVIDAANPAMTSRVGLKYFLEIKVPEYEGSSNFLALCRSQLRENPPYSAGVSTIYEGASVIYNERNGKLDSLLKIKKPNYGILEPLVVTTQSKEYILRELVTGGTPAVNTDVSKTSQWVVKAGLSEIDYQNYGDNFFSTYQSENRKFLTNQPTRKVIGKNQTEYLSFLLNTNPMPSQVRLRIEMDGLTTSTFLTVVNPPFMSVVLFPVNFTNLCLDENCTSFKVWLSNESNERLSEVRTYYIDPIERKQERYVIFSNSQSGWDTLRLTGEANEYVKVNQNALVKDKIPFDVAALPLLQITSTDGDREIIVSTGYIERNIKETLAWFEEIFLSEDIYLETEKGHRQLKRLTNQIVLKEDEFGKVARLLQFQYVESVKNFSNLPVAVAAQARAMAWSSFGNQQHILNSFGKRSGFKKPESLLKIYVDNSTAVKPITVKANTEGTEGYIDKYFDAAVTIGSTPFPNTLYTRVTSFVKNDCASGYDGLAATISIAAGTYGGEKTGDANVLAIAAADSLNTQAYANTYGACTPIGPVYTWDVPANHWHYRVKEPAKMSILYQNIGGFGEYPAGNDVSMQGLSGPYIYPVGSNDLDFPISGPPNYLGWDIVLKNYTANATKNLKFYRNGTLKFTKSIVLDNTGAWQGDAFSPSGTEGYPPNNGDTTFWEIV